MKVFRRYTMLALLLALPTQVIYAQQLTREEKFVRDINLGDSAYFVKSQRIEILPGFSAPSHSHPVPTFGVVNQGVIVYQQEGGKEI